MNTSIIEQYLEEYKVTGGYSVYGAISLFKEIPGDSRIGLSKVKVLTDNNALHVFIELPFRILRGEHFIVFKELCLINDELEENQRYELDVLTGAIRYHTVVGLPESVDDVAAVINHSLEMVAEDSSTLTHLMYEVEKAGKAAEKVSDTELDVKAAEEESVKNESVEDAVLPVRHAINFRNGQWHEVGTANIFSYNQLKHKLINLKNQVILMEGPSGCGKSSLLKEIHESGLRKVAILSAEQIRDHFIYSVTRKGNDTFQDSIEGCDVICLENTDWFFRTQTVQLEISFLVNELSRKALVVLNGIYCTERNTILLDHIHQPLTKFQFLGESEGESENAIPDKRYVSGNYAYVIQEDDTAAIVRYCGSEHTVHIPNELEGHPVTMIGEFSFCECMSLQEVHYNRRHEQSPELTISPYAFSKCENLRMVFLRCDYVDIKENAFHGCSDLHTLQIDAYNCNFERFALRGCSFLISLEIDVSRYHYKYRVIDGVLYDAINRWLLHAPDITYSGVDHLNLPEGLLCIDDHAFEDCPNISFLHIPESVICIGNDAFKGCEKLTLLVYPESYAAKYAMANSIPFSYILKNDPSDTYTFE